MLKKDTEIKLNVKAKQYFDLIKHTLTKALVLVNPHFTKDFIIFCSPSKHTITGVLLQKNREGYEQPIAFFRKDFRDSSLKYNIMEKHAFAWSKQ